jgi:prolyl-tRNA synthetase
VVARCDALVDELRAAGVRAELDDKSGGSLGRRVTGWELKGVPLRLEIGPRDLADESATLARRVTGGDKTSVALGEVVGVVRQALDGEQAGLLAEATTLRESRTVDASNLDEAREAATSGWARIPWSVVGTEGEAELAQSGVTVRCLVRSDGSLPDTDDEPDLVAYVARAY